MENQKFKMKHNCLNCKHCNDGITCNKDGSDITSFIMQEFNCCELSDLAKQNEEIMNYYANCDDND